MHNFERLFLKYNPEALLKNTKHHIKFWNRNAILISKATMLSRSRTSASLSTIMAASTDTHSIISNDECIYCVIPPG